MDSKEQTTQVELQADLYDHAPVGYLLLDQNGLIVMTNITGASMLGVKRDSLINQPFANYLTQASQNVFQQHCQQVITTQERQSCQVKLGQGARAELEVQLESIPGPGVEVDRPHLRTVLIDLSQSRQTGLSLPATHHHKRPTELAQTGVQLQPEVGEDKEMTQALVEEHNLLRALVDNLPDIIYAKDTQSRFLLINEATRRHLGAETVEEVVGKTDFNFSPQELAEQYFADEQRIFQTGEPLILHEEPIFDHETRTTRWVLTIKVPFRNAQGDIAGLVGMNRDITKLKETEAALRYAHDEVEMRVLQRTADLVKANKALKESEERLRLVIQNMPVMMNAFDTNGKIIVWNRESEQVTGYNADEIIDNTQAMALLYPDAAYRQQIMAEWQQLGNDYRNWEWEITAKYGQKKTVAWSNISNHFSIPGWAAWGIGMDVTEWRRAEESLRESEQRYRQLLNSVTDYIYTVKVENYQVTATTHSPNCVAVTGYTWQEYEANPHLWYQMIYEEDRHLVEEQVNALLANSAVSPVEHRIIHKNGSVRWVRNTAVLRRDEYGKVISYEGLISDITARKEAEEALRRSESKYRLLMENASDGIIILDQTGHVRQVNSKVCEMLQYPREELLGQHISSFIPASELAVMPLGFDELLSGKTLLRERMFRRQDGTLAPVEISSKLIEPNNILAILRDISERKAVERRENLAHQLGRQLTTLLDPQALLTETVNRLKETFGYYYVHVYLTHQFDRFRDSDQEVLVIHEGTGESGAALKAQQYAIPLNARRSLVAQAARSLQPVVVNDVSQHPEHLPNPFLPQTRSEAAFPLFRGHQLIGVLDVQHNETGHFNDFEIRTLQIIASQLSVALANAQLFAEQERLIAEVKAGRERLQQLSHRLVEVQEAERRHIARELHDAIGQLLTGLKLTLEMSVRLPYEEIRPSLDEPQLLVNELIARVRELSLELRPAMLDDLGLLPTLAWHFERYAAQTKIRVNLKQTGLEGKRFALATETAAYRIIQEALTNVARHAGAAAVSIQLWLEDQMLTVQIEDQGAGFDLEGIQAAGSSSGLSGMAERAALLGGALVIEARLGAGTRITAQIPLETPGQNEVEPNSFNRSLPQ